MCTENSYPGYNEGLDDFDVTIYQHDNYGLYLNKRGETIDYSILSVNSNNRYTLPGFTTNVVIPFECHTSMP